MKALGELCSRYWYPLYAFSRRSGSSAEDAEDLVQGFLSRSSCDGLFARADAEKGRLRTLLVTAFRRYARDEYEKSIAAKRGQGNVISFDATEAELWYCEGASATETPEATLDREWAVTLLESAMERLASTWEEKGKSDHFSLLRPYLTATITSRDYDRISAATGMKPGTVKVTLHRLRASFGLALREEISGTLEDDSDIDAELNYLIQLV
jgi:RNA polymerase sigma-70 factor (ECF subfamily)